MRSKSLFFEKKCEICNKIFFPTVSWTYKIKGYTTKIKWYCSYNCYNKGKEKNEENKKRSFKWRNGDK